MEPLAPTGPLTAAVAADVIAATVRHADSLGVRVSVAIVDAGGTLKAFLRMDGAEIAGATLATDKAFTAVANRAATHELAALAQPGQPLFGLHAGAGGRYVIFGGGIPVAVAGELAGAIGVSGAEAWQDVECAAAAAQECRRLLGVC